MTTGNQIQAHRESRPTTPFSAPWLQRLRRGLGTTNGKPVLMAGMSLSEQERQQIPVVTSSLRERLSAGPHEIGAIGAEVTKMLAAFPRRDDGVSELTLRADAYLDALGGEPAWAVHEARLKVIRGEIGSLDTRFAPTPPQFAELVRGVLKPLRDDLADLECLSSAVAEHDPSPEERARVAEGFANLRASFPSAQKRGEQPDAAKASLADEALRQRLRDNGQSDEEVEATMAALKPAPPRPGSFASMKRSEVAA